MTDVTETDIVFLMRLDKLSFSVFNTINTHRLIKAGDAIMVGVSGGPDSIALVKILHTMNASKGLRLRFVVAHLNHQLRGKSAEEDAQFVRDFAAGLSLPCVVKELDIQKIADQTKYSIEEAARTERYRFFLDAAREQGATLIALGHTADDNAETILHRIIRGAGAVGLGGIPIKRPLAPDSPIQIIRPLLFTWRKEIIQYLKDEQLGYRTDESNHETTYLRNKIRLNLIPLLESQYNPNIKNTLNQLCRIFSENNEYLSSEAKKALKSATIQGDRERHVIDARFLMTQPKILQHRVIQEVMNNLRIPLKEITYEHYTTILDGIVKAGRMRRFQLPGKLCIQYERHRLHFSKESPPKPDMPLLSEIPVRIPGTTSVSSLGQLSAEILEIHDISPDVFKKTKTKNEEMFDLESITHPLGIRGRKKGDVISPLGVNGHKKLKELFIDRKIPVEERNAMPIVVMNGRPVWVVGVCIDNGVKVTSHTKKILKLTFSVAL
ncbi:MAG: tRNA lysidine(34) synthetase TilS [Planctomycetota bacterium]